MTIGSVRVDDVLRCDVRGDRFWAIATAEAAEGFVKIAPLNGRPIPTYRVKARQVVGHWRMAKGSVTI